MKLGTWTYDGTMVVINPVRKEFATAKSSKDLYMFKNLSFRMEYNLVLTGRTSLAVKQKILICASSIRFPGLAPKFCLHIIPVP